MEAIWSVLERLMGDIMLRTSQEWAQVLSLATEHKLQRR